MDFFDFILLSVYALDKSKPIERTWKGVAAMMGAVLLSSAAVYGFGIIVLYKSYLWGAALISASIAISALWYYAFRRINRGKQKERS